MSSLGLGEKLWLLFQKRRRSNSARRISIVKRKVTIKKVLHGPSILETCRTAPLGRVLGLELALSFQVGFYAFKTTSRIWTGFDTWTPGIWNVRGGATEENPNP